MKFGALRYRNVGGCGQGTVNVAQKCVDWESEGGAHERRLIAGDKH